MHITETAAPRFPSRAAWLRVGDDVRLAAILVSFLRVGLGLIAVVGLAAVPPIAAKGDWPELLLPGNDPWTLALSAWQRWDALWYQQISEQGYAAGNGTPAFFPLYPLITAGLARGLHAHSVWAELAVSTLACGVAFVLLHRLTTLELGPRALARGPRSDGAVLNPARAATLSVVLTAAFPVGFFLLAPYTESLFLALTLAAFWLARTNRPWAAGAVGFLAALTRGQGLLLVLPLVWERLRRRGDGWRPIAPTIAASFLPVAGFLTFSFYLQTVVGERETGLSALQIWGYKQVLPWDSVSASWSYITQGFASAGLAQSPDGLPIPLTPGLASIEVLNLVSLVLFTLLGLVVVRMLSLSYGLYAWSSLALLWTRNMWYSPLMSTSRYLLVLFPCFMVAGALLAGRPRAGFAWLCISGMLQVGLFVIWVLWGFVA